MAQSVKAEITTWNGPGTETFRTFRNVIDYIKDKPDIPQRRRGQILSALNTLCRILGLDAGDIAIDPQSLRVRLEAVSHIASGLTASRWAAVRSLTIGALNECGFDIMPSKRVENSLVPQWEVLWTSLPIKKLKYGLSRFVSFCSSCAISPGDVDDNTFTRFRMGLETTSLIRQVSRAYRNAMLCWNEAAQRVPAWPKFQITIPSESLRYALSFDEFPASFKEDTEAYLNKASDPDPFSDDYSRALRPATVKSRRNQILRLATTLVTPEYPASNVTCLAVLVTPQNAMRSLRFFLNRADGKHDASIYHYATLLRTIARHWVKPFPEADLAELDKFCKNLTPKSHGMTEKNRGRLRQFDEPANIDALIHLPERMFRKCQIDDDGGWHVASRMSIALAIDLLISAPMRIKNLTNLEIERHIVRAHIGANSVVHLVIPGEETKTGEPFEMELPSATVVRLDLYLRKYRPRLISAPSIALFPGQAGEKRNPSGFGRRISDIILSEAGIKMNPHLFRHAAAKFHLEAHPEDVETVRRILGHRSLDTTLRVYADMQTSAAFERYGDVIEGLRAGSTATTKSKLSAYARRI